ncbi:MAG: hypothetical protein AB7O97_04285 [Planctomycetota bacterium]
MSALATITAIFDSPVSAGRAVDRLLDAGVARGRITVLMAESVRDSLERPIDAAAEPAAQEAARGAATGAMLGGTLAALLGTAASLSGIGLVAVGPLAALLGAGAVGATAGGLLGTLVGLGVRGDVARVYERDLDAGKVLVGVTVLPERAAAIEQTLTDGGGANLARIDRVG